MDHLDYTAPARIGSDYATIPPITDGQRRAWRREIAARFNGDARAEMVEMVLGEGAPA